MRNKVKSFNERSEFSLEKSIQKFLDDNGKLKVITLSYTASPKTFDKDYSDDYSVDDYQHFAILVYEEIEEEKDIIFE